MKIRPKKARIPASEEVKGTRAAGAKEAPGRELPSSPAAPGLSAEVRGNLQGEKPGEVHTSVHARVAQMGRNSADAVKLQVDRFLANPKVQTVGHGLNEAARSGVDFFADGADFWTDALGDLTDAGADKVIGTGEGLNKLADEGRAKLQNAIDDLRGRSLGLAAEAERLMSPELDAEKKLEVQQMWASGKVLGAVAKKLEALIHLDDAKAFCANGGSALFKVTSDVFEVMGELAHKGAKGLGAAITMTGRFFKWLVGKDTLRSTALSFYGGLRMNVGSEKFNAGVGGGFYFPSFKEREAKAEKEGKTAGVDDSYYDCVVFDWGVSAASPYAGGGWNSRGGAGAGVNLYFVSATFNEMTERVFLGVPGVWGVTLGRDKERGSEINFGSGVGLAGGSKLGAYASYGVAVHTPLLDPVNKFITRPIAKVIVGATRLVTGGAKWTYGRISGAHGERAGPDVDNKPAEPLKNESFASGDFPDAS